MISFFFQVAIHVVAITPPPVHAPSRLRFLQAQFGAATTGILNRSTARAGAYGAALKAEADALGMACLDVHSAMLAADGGEAWPIFLGANDLKVNAHISRVRTVYYSLKCSRFFYFFRVASTNSFKYNLIQPSSFCKELLYNLRR